MNRSTQTALIALIASIAFIGANASAQETSPPARAPEIKSWEELAAEHSNYDPLACDAYVYSARVCRPKLEADGSYSEECQEMLWNCGVLVPEGGAPYLPEYDVTYYPAENPFNWPADSTGASDSSWLYEDDHNLLNEDYTVTVDQSVLDIWSDYDAANTE